MAERLARIQLLIDTTANWQAANPILLRGEVGLEIKTGGEIAFKAGNGTTAWNSLDYVAFTPSEVEAIRDNLQSQIDGIVIAASSGADPEVAQARVNASGTTYNTLKARLDAMDVETSDVKSDLTQYSTLVSGYYVRYQDGKIGTFSSLKYAEFPVSEGLKITYKYKASPDARGLAFYNLSGSFISGLRTINEVQEVVVPKNAVLLRATVSSVDDIKISYFVNAVSKLVDLGISSFVTVTKTGQLNDANNAPINKICSILTSSFTDNLPTHDYTGGQLFTFNSGSSDETRAQIYLSSKNTLYTRAYWGSSRWSDWRNYYIDNIHFNGIVTSDSFADCNNADINGIYTVNDTNVLNLPVKQKGVLICNSGSSNGNSSVTGGCVQIYYTADGNSVYYRCTVFGSSKVWTTWNTFGSDYNTAIATSLTATPLEHIRNDAGMLSCFLKVGCIGDSLSSGECVYKDSSGSHGVDLYQHSWGQYLARMTGNTYYNFSVGGLSAKTFHSTRNTKVREFDDADKVCDMYFIGLGQNDNNASNPIGTSADINMSNYNNNADSFYGNYGKIIQKIKAKQPKAKIFVFTDPLNAVETAGYNNAVREMATLFSNVYVLDMYTYGNGMYRGSSSFIYNQNRVGHYNAISYKAMANIIATYVDWIMKTRPSEFNQIEFIGTNYNY